MDGVWIRPNAPRQLPVGATVRFGASTREYKVTLGSVLTMWHAQLDGEQPCNAHASGGRALVVGSLHAQILLSMDNFQGLWTLIINPRPAQPNREQACYERHVLAWRALVLGCCRFLN